MPVVEQENAAQKTLSFDRLPFCHRNRELELLEEAYRRVKTSNDNPYPQKRQVVVCQGNAGVGKSRLLSHYFKEQQKRLWDENDECYYHHVKFTEFGNQHQTSYGPILLALDDLLLQALQADEDSLTVKINSGMTASDTVILTSLLPTFCDYFGRRDSTLSTGSSHNGYDKMKTRGYQIPIALLSLLRLLASNRRPVVMAFGGLQFAESSALQLITKISIDNRVEGLLLIYSFRNQTVPKVLLDSLEEMKLENIAFMEVTVEPMSWEDMRDLISTTLGDTPEHLSPDMDQFCALLHENTGGNLALAEHFLHALEVKGYLQRSNERTEEAVFQWNLSYVQSGLEFLRDNGGPSQVLFQQLPDDCRLSLTIAACLGAQFDSQLVQYLVQNFSLGASNSSSLLQSQVSADDLDLSCFEKQHLVKLQEAERLNLIVAGNDQMPHNCSFVNKQVRTVVRCNESNALNQPSMHLQICKLLQALITLDVLPGNRNKQVLLQLAANQVNQANELVVDEPSSIEATKLNLATAEAVLKHSVFFQAFAYLQHAKSHLDKMNDRWGNENYDLSLKTCTLLVNCAGCCGEYETCLDVSQEMQLNARCLDDCLRVRQVRLIALTSIKQFSQAVKEAKKLLKDLGVKLRPNTFTMIMAVTKLKFLLGGAKTDQELIPTKPMSDPLKTEIMSIMNLVADAAFVSGRFEVFTVFQYQQLELSLKYGALPSSAQAYASMGVVLAAIGDFDEAYRMSKVVRMVDAEWSMGGLSTNGEWTCQLLIDHWKRPLIDNSDQLLVAHEHSMKSGDVLNAFWCIVVYTGKYFFSGLKLAPLFRDCQQYASQMRVYKQIMLLDVLLPYFQTGANLMDCPPKCNPVILQGEFIPNLPDFLKKCDTKDDVFAINSVKAGQLMLGYLFDDLVTACKAGNHFSDPDIVQRLGTSPPLPTIVLLRGLVAFAMARKRSKWKRIKYTRKGKKQLKQMETWTKGGAVNCFHMMKLLQAELLSLAPKAKRADISERYDEAISSAGRSGFLNNQAIASLRKGVWHHQLEEMEDAKHMMSQACELFHEWGANRVVQHILEKYDFVKCESMTSHTKASGGTNKSVQRYDPMLAESHHRSNAGSDVGSSFIASVSDFDSDDDL